jgi:hypothetical protein
VGVSGCQPVGVSGCQSVGVAVSEVSQVCEGFRVLVCGGVRGSFCESQIVGASVAECQYMGRSVSPVRASECRSVGVLSISL